MAISDNWLKNVAQELLSNIDEKPNLCMLLDEAGGAADTAGTYRFPGIEALTVATSGASAGASQEPTDASLSFTADKDPAVQVDIKKVDQVNIGGHWETGLARRCDQALKNNMDLQLCTELADVTSISLTKTNSVVGTDTGAKLKRSDWEKALELLGDLPGADERNMLWLVDGKGIASIRSIASTDWVSGGGDAAIRGMLGLPIIGYLHGIPVLNLGRALPRLKSVATSAVSITSNVATATIPAGHGLNVGELVTTAGLTANQATPTPVLTVGATSATFALTASDGAMADGVGTIVCQSSRNLLIDQEFVRSAVNLMPSVEKKTKEQSTTRILEVTTVFGFGAVAGRAVHLCVPLA